ncbi:proline-rich protein 2-like [Penaeus monodon]|uniref:proline-rich protein 2-like n=1 Tax=Penaeus monodon TaxID=6687 RepID=UPI0018A7BADD|nr:proline-rich protein 2-like [Penaeus monodon]
MHGLIFETTYTTGRINQPAAVGKREGTPGPFCPERAPFRRLVPPTPANGRGRLCDARAGRLGLFGGRPFGSEGERANPSRPAEQAAGTAQKSHRPPLPGGPGPEPPGADPSWEKARPNPLLPSPSSPSVNKADQKRPRRRNRQGNPLGPRPFLALSPLPLRARHLWRPHEPPAQGNRGTPLYPGLWAPGPMGPFRPLKSPIPCPPPKLRDLKRLPTLPLPNIGNPYSKPPEALKHLGETCLRDKCYGLAPPPTANVGRAG